MRVSLVYAPYGPTPNEPNVSVVIKNYGLFPSLSLGYAASILEKAGIQVQYIDANALELSVQQTIAMIREFKPDLVGYTVTTPLFFQTLYWIRAIKEATGIPTLIGGVHVSVFPEETMVHPEIDYAIDGEAEQTLPELIQAMQEGRDPAGIPGTIVRQDGKVVRGAERPLTKDLDTTPFPLRDQLPNDRYFSFISRHRNFAPLITSRGCPYRCIFCEQGSKKFRRRSADNVVDEMELCVRKFGVKEFDFFDSSFTTRKSHTIGICDEINRRNINTVWAARSRVDLVNEEILKALCNAGCERIYYGIESGVPEILETLAKKVDLDQIKNTLALTRKMGIESFGFFMIGNPGETRQTVKQTFRFVSGLKLDYIQYSKLIPLPSTKIYEMLLEENPFDYWREFVAGRTPEMTLTRPLTKLTEEEVQQFVREGYLRFYFRPIYILRALRRMRSFEEFKRSVTAAAGVFIMRFLALFRRTDQNQSNKDAS